MGRNRAGGANEMALGRLARMAITRQFVNAYRATTTDRYLVTQIQECIVNLWTYPRPRGLNVELLGGSGLRRFWSARVDQNWRIIFLVPRNDEVILVHVASHDRAYAWAETHGGQAPALGTQASAYDPEMKVADAVSAFGLPSAEETARAVQSAADFAAMCDRGLESYFTTLDSSQHDLVEMNPAGNFLALGGPGTGKTVVAIHRVARHLREGNRVAYVCFNRPLHQATQQMIEAVAPDAPDHLRYIGTMHDLCLRIIKTAGGSMAKPAHPDVFDAAVNEAVRMLPADLKRAALTSRTSDETGRSAPWITRDFADEIRQVIMACHVRNQSDYLALDRSWRGGQLGSDARRAVWAAYEATSSALEAKGLVAWDDLTRRAADALAHPVAPNQPFCEIVIDEIQDIAPGFIEVANLLVEPVGGRIFALGDPEQVLYGRPITLALDRVSPHRHDRRWLSRDYRSTRQGWRLAESWRVIDRGAATIRESEVAPIRVGPVPRLIIESDHDSALDAAVDAVVGASRTTNLGMIGVLYLGTETGKRIVASLISRGLDAAIVDGNSNMRFADPVVKVVTIRRSKGLDFPSLFVLLPDDQDPSRDPITWADRALGPEARRVLYVAATRASRELVFVTGIAAPHPLLMTLDHSSYRAEGTRGGDWRRRVGGEDPEDPKPGMTPVVAVADTSGAG